MEQEDMRGEKLCLDGLRISLVSLLLLVKTFFLCGQLKWDGGAGDGLWSNPVNWAGDILPALNDDVVLDNTYVQGSYKVSFASGNLSVSIRSLLIAPGGVDSISLELPKTNTISPGLQVTGSGFPLIIRDRGILINASGSSSGSSIVVTDSIRLENGGTYIHRTARAHAALVMLLSRAAGTEEGQFWFDIPDVSSTISLSNRSFGKLRLSANAAGGSLNYTAAATQKIRVRSDLLIDPGVKLNLNCSDTFHVARDLIQTGGTLNLSSSTRLLVMAVGGSVTTSSGALITETGSTSPVLLLNGSSAQSIRFAGSLSNQVVFRLYNSAGAILQNPLSIPYLFDLKKGKITTDASNLLILISGANLSADSLKLDTYINGPVRFEGLTANYKLIPVGGSGELRWISLHRASGSFTVWYVRADGRLIDSRVDGVHHISGQEYWNVRPETAASAADIEISFNDANQSGVTDLATLHIARLSASGWIDAGSQATRGSAGGRGSVVSELQQFPESYANALFVLASMDPNQNPLPVLTTLIQVEERSQETLVRFNAKSCLVVSLQCESQNGSFRTIDERRYLSANSNNVFDSFRILRSKEVVYRLAFYGADSVVRYSRQFVIHAGQSTPFRYSAFLSGRTLKLSCFSDRDRNASLRLYDLAGRLLVNSQLLVRKGTQCLDIQIPDIHEKIVVLNIAWAGGYGSGIIALHGRK